MPLSRRSFLGALSGVSAAWLGADGALLRETARQAQLHIGGLRVLTSDEAAALDALTAQILPTDDQPGAREANVVRFIDHALAGFASDQVDLFRQGVRDLDGEARRRHPEAGSFARLTPGDQVALMRSLEASGSPFFEAALVATMSGTFADPAYGGNTDKVGWKLIGFEDRFAWQPPFGAYD
jgi:gluconate 2-dehydrogenase gamma chain